MSDTITKEETLIPDLVPYEPELYESDIRKIAKKVIERVEPSKSEVPEPEEYKLPEITAEDVLALLKVSRKYISDKNNWMAGGFREDDKVCAVGSIILNSNDLYGFFDANFTRKAKIRAIDALQHVSFEQYGEKVENINDGFGGRKNSHQRVLDLYDKAIDRVETKGLEGIRKFYDYEYRYIAT